MRRFGPDGSDDTVITYLVMVCMPVVFCLMPGACNEEPSSPPSGTSTVRSGPAAEITGTEPEDISVVQAEKEPNRTTFPKSQVGKVVSEWPHPRAEERRAERQQMVLTIRDVYGLQDSKVLEAMTNVPRHWFVPASEQRYAYADTPLPIGYGQTISQPFIVAHMTELLELDETKKVLEIGTGSGYQAAVLTEFTPYVYTIEIVKPLAETAAQRLKEHGYTTVKVKADDGYKGWSEYAPFDAIIVTAAPEQIPPPLLEQLKPAGRMYIPVGENRGVQNLVLVTKDEQGKITLKPLIPVRFVPLTREKEQ